jgi:hypothetical protein
MGAYIYVYREGILRHMYVVRIGLMNRLWFCTRTYTHVQGVLVKYITGGNVGTVHGPDMCTYCCDRFSTGTDIGDKNNGMI